MPGSYFRTVLPKIPLFSKLTTNEPYEQKSHCIYLNKPLNIITWEVSCKPSLATQSFLRIYLLSSILKYSNFSWISSFYLNTASLSSKFDGWTCKIDAFIGMLAWFRFQFHPGSHLSFSMSVPYSESEGLFFAQKALFCVFHSRLSPFSDRANFNSN